VAKRFGHFTRSPEYALLGFLYQKPNYGYNLHQLLINELGFVWHVNQSQTYNILRRLEAQGYVSSDIQEQEKLPPRHILQITETGRRRFEDWMQTPLGSSVRAIRLEFITRLYFAQKYFPYVTPKLIEDEAEEINTVLTRLEADRGQIPSDQAFNRLSLDLRIQQLHAVSDWVNQCRKDFEIKSQGRA
jgi:DNA-binding PadR family transcriptional regulator